MKRPYLVLRYPDVLQLLPQQLAQGQRKFFPQCALIRLDGNIVILLRGRQKRLLAAGFPRTFEIGRLYRNEGTSPEHAQEFTNLEFYASYMSFDEGISFTEKMIKEIVYEPGYEDQNYLIIYHVGLAGILWGSHCIYHENSL